LHLEHRQAARGKRHSTCQNWPVKCQLVLLITAFLFTGCISARRSPDLARVFADARTRSGKRPIIVIPGILGSQLIDSRTGAVVWPSIVRSSADSASLPLTPDLDANRDHLVPGKIVDTLRLAKALPEVYVYRDLLEALRKFGGYREGEWDQPEPDGYQDTYYVFAYDWRLDNAANAQELVRRLRSLKQRLGRPELRFSILAHSMGGLIARYAAMYGDAALPSGDETATPTWAGASDIKTIIMLGVPNEGSADAFATLIDGYSITEGLRRRVPLFNKLTAEDALSSPSVFQLLPHRNATRFLDENLQPMQIDLYDPEVWRRYGWSAVNDPAFRRKYERVAGVQKSSHKSNSALPSLDAYFKAVLERARKFQEALDAVPPRDAPVTVIAVGGDCEQTLNAPVILRDPKHNRWQTLIRPKAYRTTGGRRISKREATAAMFAPGDGRVTRRSLLGEDLNGRAGAPTYVNSPLAVYAVFACDLHGQLQRNKTLEDNALTALVNDVIK
jgi:pimeloyl-ACP methyl ester carboxylesterase